MSGSNPGLFTRRWMLFVDGENFTIRAQAFAEHNKLNLVEGPNYRKDVFVWLPGKSPTSTSIMYSSVLQLVGVRASYYTSVSGDEPLLTNVKDSLWHLGFNPCVFKKDSQSKKTKGVDITLTKDMLSHAYFGNYDAAGLVAGDADYVPLVEEVKRFGKVVHVVFFGSHGLSPDLRRSADVFLDISDIFKAAWT